MASRPAPLHGAFGFLSQSNAAMYNLVLTFKQAEAESDWLANVTPANWSERVPQSQNMVAQLFNQYDKLVRGQTGSDDAESKLLDYLNKLQSQLNDLVTNAPSWLQQAGAKTARFFSDFTDGVNAARQDVSEWAIKNAGPILRKFYDAAVQSIVLRNELKSLQASGDIPPDMAAQRSAELDQGDALLNAVRSAYKTLSGADIDTLAQQEFGSYPGLQGWPIVVIAAIGVTAISALVIRAWTFMNALSPITDQAKAAIKQVQDIAKQAGDQGGSVLAKAANIEMQTETVLTYVYWAAGAVALGGIAVAVYYFTKKD